MDKPLPAGWRRVRLGEVCREDRVIIDPTSPDANNLPFLGLEHIESETGIILLDPEDLPHTALSTTFLFDTGHVLYGKLRPYLNKVAIPNFSGKCSTEIVPLYPINVERYYLAWFLRRQETVSEAMKQKTGSRMPRADLRELFNLSIPLPPLDEQQRIVAILNEKMAAVQQARRAAEEQLRAVQALPAAYLRQAFPQPGQPLPAGWRRVRLGNLGVLDSGGTPAKKEPSYWNGNIPFVTGADITNLYITSQNARTFLTEAGLSSGKPAVCHPGTVIIVTRTRVGRIGIAAEIMGASQDISPFHCGETILAEYLVRYWQSIADFIISNTRGATIQGLTKGFVTSLSIPLPPLDEQQRIVAILNEKMAAVQQARRAAEEQLRAVQALPAAYLRQAFSGEL